MRPLKTIRKFKKVEEDFNSMLDLLIPEVYFKSELQNSLAIAPVDGVKHQHFILSQI